MSLLTESREMHSTTQPKSTEAWGLLAMASRWNALCPYDAKPSYVRPTDIFIFSWSHCWWDVVHCKYLGYRHFKIVSSVRKRLAKDWWLGRSECSGLRVIFCWRLGWFRNVVNPAYTALHAHSSKKNCVCSCICDNASESHYNVHIYLGSAKEGRMPVPLK